MGPGASLLYEAEDLAGTGLCPSLPGASDKALALFPFPAASWQCGCSLGLLGRGEVAGGKDPGLELRGLASGFGCDLGKSLNYSAPQFSQLQNGDDIFYPRIVGRLAKARNWGLALHEGDGYLH